MRLTNFFPGFWPPLERREGGGIFIGTLYIASAVQSYRLLPLLPQLVPAAATSKVLPPR